MAGPKCPGLSRGSVPAIHVFLTSHADHTCTGGWVYVMTIKRNGALYVGVTNDLVRRVWEDRAWIRRYWGEDVDGQARPSRQGARHDDRATDESGSVSSGIGPMAQATAPATMKTTRVLGSVGHQEMSVGSGPVAVARSSAAISVPATWCHQLRAPRSSEGDNAARATTRTTLRKVSDRLYIRIYAERLAGNVPARRRKQMGDGRRCPIIYMKRNVAAVVHKTAVSVTVSP